MNIVALRSFVAVADRGSVSGAAEAVGYSRSTVTDQLHGLEREVGVPLLVRGNPIRLSPAGRSFLPHARVILYATEQGVNAARRRHDEEAPRRARRLPNGAGPTVLCA